MIKVVSTLKSSIICSNDGLVAEIASAMTIYIMTTDHNNNTEVDS